MKVRKGGTYRFNPVDFDKFYPCHSIAIGEHVRVGNVPGMPHGIRPWTLGMYSLPQIHSGRKS